MNQQQAMNSVCCYAADDAHVDALVNDGRDEIETAAFVREQAD